MTLKDTEGHWRVKGSRYYILVNTNHSFVTEHELSQAADVLRMAIEQLGRGALAEYDLLNFHDWRDGRKGGTMYYPNYALIRNVKIVYKLETGPSNHFLHAHIDMTIYHESCITLNLAHMRDYFVSQLLSGGCYWCKNVFLRSKWARANMTQIYLGKQDGMTSEVKESRSEEDLGVEELL